MVSRVRIKQVIGVLQKAGRVQKNQLIRLIVDEGLMSHQTASDAIDESVKSYRIFRQDDHKGKQKIVWLSINDDIQKIEDMLKKAIEMVLNKFDLAFELFRRKYPKLSIEEKSDGLDAFVYLFRTILVSLEHLHEGFGKTRFWTDLLKETMQTRLAKFWELSNLETEVNRLTISRILLSYKLEDVEDAFGFVDEFLDELK